MSTQNTHEKTVSRKQTRKKKGLIYLLIAAGCLVISYIMYASGIEGGVIFALISFAMLICFIVGLIYLIAGFLGKE